MDSQDKLPCPACRKDLLTDNELHFVNRWGEDVFKCGHCYSRSVWDLRAEPKTLIKREYNRYKEQMI
jgi:hypothetical protein